MTLFLQRRPALLLLALLLLGGTLITGLSACDSNDTGEGYFEARGTNVRLEGLARFSTGEDGRFVLDLTDLSNSDDGFVLARGATGAGGVPGSGRYDFAFPEGRALPIGGRFVGALEISGFGGPGPALYYAVPSEAEGTGGSLTITSRSEERVTGAFTFRARRVETGGAGNAPLSIDVSGRFRAERGATDRFPFTGGS